MSKQKHMPATKSNDNKTYLRNTNTEEARRVVEECRLLPHLNKPIKYYLK